MAADKMHADEVHTDASLVRRLLAAQFPQWADLPIERGRVRRHGQRDLSSGRRHVRAPAAHRLGDRPGREGGALAAEARAASAARHPCSARDGRTRRGLPMAVVHLAVDRRRGCDGRTPPRSERGGGGSGGVPERAVADRYARAGPRRAGTTSSVACRWQCETPAPARRSLRGKAWWISRHLTARGKRRSPRRHGTERPSGSTAISCRGTFSPPRPSERGHRLRLPGRGRSGSRPDRGVVALLWRKPRGLPRSARRR